MLAAIRPGDWNVPLLVHVTGAMLVLGSLVAVASVAAAARRRNADAATLARLGFRVLLLGVLPAWVLMRVGAEWVASKQDWGDPAWIGIGYAAADGGLVLTVIATVLAWQATRSRASAPASAVVALSSVLLIAYAATIWAMTTKPG